MEIRWKKDGDEIYGRLYDEWKWREDQNDKEELLNRKKEKKKRRSVELIDSRGKRGEIEWKRKIPLLFCVVDIMYEY